MRWTTNRRSFFRVLALGPIFACALAGCGRGGPEVAPISGTVTHGGQPVKEFAINFVPEKGRPSWGFTDPEGRYTLHYTKDVDGAILGKHRVWVAYQPSDHDTQLQITEGKFKFPPEILDIEAKYGQNGSKKLEFEITGAQTIDLKLD